MNAPGLMRLPAVLAARDCGRTRLYADCKEGVWTQPVRIGPNFSAWPSDEVEALIAARVAGVSNDEMRALVHRLHEQRKSRFAAMRSRLLAASVPAEA